MITLFGLQKHPIKQVLIQEGLLSVTSESMCTKYWLTALLSLPMEQVWLGELTVPT